MSTACPTDGGADVTPLIWAFALKNESPLEKRGCVPASHSKASSCLTATLSGSHLKRSSVASFQREQEALEGRKEGLQGECYVPPPSRAVGGQELPWAVAMLPILPTCEMSQVCLLLLLCARCEVDPPVTLCLLPFFHIMREICRHWAPQHRQHGVNNCEQLQLQRGLWFLCLLS